MVERITLALVIPTYGRVDSLRRLLGSIAAQTMKPHELIVVDQNPPDFLRGVVPAWADHLRLDEPNAAMARNAGFLASRATHVTFIDDDLVLGSDHVARLVETFTAHPGVRCIWPVVHHDGKEKTLRALRRNALRGSIEGTSLFVIRRPGSGGIAFERNLFLDLGGYDDLLFRFGRTGEDWELSRRMRHAKVEVWCDPELSVEHTAEEQGGCAIRAVPYEEARRRVNASTMLGLRLRGGSAFRLRLRDLPSIIRYSLLSSLGRPDARRAVLRHPLRHLRMIADAIRASREFVTAHAGRYSSGGQHLEHAATILLRDSVESRSA